MHHRFWQTEAKIIPGGHADAFSRDDSEQLNLSMAKFKLKFVACPSIAPRTITSAMGPVAQGPFSTSSEAPATILGSAGPSCSIYELREQRDLTNADPSFSWSSCTHAASAAQ